MAAVVLTMAGALITRLLALRFGIKSIFLYNVRRDSQDQRQARFTRIEGDIFHFGESLRYFWDIGRPDILEPFLNVLDTRMGGLLAALEAPPPPAGITPAPLPGIVDASDLTPEAQAALRQAILRVQLIGSRVAGVLAVEEPVE